MSLHASISGQSHSSFHYARAFREDGNMAEAERVLANRAAANPTLGLAPDGRYVNGRQGTDLQAFQADYSALEGITPTWENDIPSRYALLRSRISHSPINLPVDGLGYPQPVRFENMPVVRLNDKDLPSPQPN